MKAEKLTEKQVADELEKLPGWAIKSGNLHQRLNLRISAKHSDS